MRKISLILFIIALILCLFTDITISSGNTYSELKKIISSLFTPDFLAVTAHGKAFVNTIVFAICGTLLGVTCGFIFSFFYLNRVVRFVLSFVRSIHEIFWVMLLMTPLGLNDVTAVLGIAIPYSAIFAKVYNEIIQESAATVTQALPAGSDKISGFLYTVLPGVFGEMKSYTSYRFECALRSSTVIGFVGFPTIGYHLESYFSEGYYSEAAALFYLFLAIIATRRLWLNKYTLLLVTPATLILMNWQSNFSLDNMERFMYECIPFPIRNSLDKGMGIDWGHLYQWSDELLTRQIIPGLWSTFTLTQISLVCTGLVTLISFPSATRLLAGSRGKFGGKALLLFFRTIPEYILAFVLVLPLGPSMLPGIMTISLHNGAIIAHLIANSADFIKLKHDHVRGKVNLYFFEVIPKVYGQFLAFLFYRWEIMMRESAILGLLGISTIGFYIDNALSEQRMDRVVILIACTAALNIAIDSLSTFIRRKLKVSGKITSSS